MCEQMQFTEIRKLANLASRQNFNLKTLENQLFFQGNVEAYQKHTPVHMLFWSLERRRNKLYHTGATCTCKTLGCP